MKEEAQAKRRNETAGEIEAMRVAYNALNKLSESARWRAMRWLDHALRDVNPNEEPPF